MKEIRTAMNRPALRSGNSSKRSELGGSSPHPPTSPFAWIARLRGSNYSVLCFLLLFFAVVTVVYFFENLDSNRVGGPLSPPFTVTYRNSHVGRGVVMDISNRSGATLYGVRVTIKAKDGRHTSAEVIDALRPGEDKEVGWLQLHQWVLEAGEEVSIYASGYPAPFHTTCVLPR